MRSTVLSMRSSSVRQALVEPSAAVSLEAPQSAQPARPADETPVAETAAETTAAAPIPPAETDASLRVLLEPTPEGAPPAVPDRERIEPDAETPVRSTSETEVQELGKATGLILPREMTEVPGYSKWSVGVMAASIDHAPEKPARWPYVLVASVFIGFAWPDRLPLPQRTGHYPPSYTPGTGGAEPSAEY